MVAFSISELIQPFLTSLLTPHKLIIGLYLPRQSLEPQSPFNLIMKGIVGEECLLASGRVTETILL